jgi:ABC-2 type transport system permease protein
MIRPGEIGEQVRRSVAVARKDIRIYYVKGPVVIFGLLIPLFLFLAFSLGNRFASVPFLISGLLAMTVFFTATAVSPVIFPWETQARTLERLAAAPITVPALVFGDVLASFLFGAFVPVGIGIALGVAITSPAVLIVGILLGALCFASLGVLLAVPPARAPQNIMMLSSLVKFPLIFISGIFIPVESLPVWGQVLAAASPLTYFTDIARYGMGEVNTYPIALDLVVLAGFSLLFLGAAMVLHTRTLPERL